MGLSPSHTCLSPSSIDSGHGFWMDSGRSSCLCLQVLITGVYYCARLASCFCQEIFLFFASFLFPREQSITWASASSRAFSMPSRPTRTPSSLLGLITSCSQHSRQSRALGCSPHSGSLSTPQFPVALRALFLYLSHLSL